MEDATEHTRRSLLPAGCAVLLGCVVLLAAGGGYVYWSANRDPDLVIPPRPTAPVPNGYDDFVTAGRLALAMRHHTPIDARHPESEPLADYAAAAADAGPALSALRAGLAKATQSPLIGTPGAGTQKASIHELSRVLVGLARYYDLKGQPDRATDTRLDGLMLGVKLGKGGDLAIALAGRSILLSNVYKFEVDLPRCSAAGLANAASRLDAIKSEERPYADNLEMDTNGAAATLLEILRGPDNPASFHGAKRFTAVSDDASFGEQLRSNWAAVNLMMSNKRRIAREDYDAAMKHVAEARKPYGTGAPVKAPTNEFVRFFYYEDQGQREFVALEAAIEVLRAEVACYRYRAAHGRFPGSLDSLVPTSLDKVPDDPCSGGSSKLKYRATDGGKSFLLYSIGPDCRDDGGAPGSILLGGKGDLGDLVAGQLLGRPRAASH